MTTSAPGQQLSSDRQTDDKSTTEPYVAVVFGAVSSPGRFQLRRRHRLSEILKLAGGLTPRADRTIQLIHSEPPNDTRTEVAPKVSSEVYKWDELSRDDEKANPYLKPGDIVIAREAPAVSVIGSVAQPRSFPFRAGMTLTRTIAMARGPSMAARTREIVVYRSIPEDSTQVLLRFDLKAIVKHSADDPVLQPGDVIEVPPSRRVYDLKPTLDSPPLRTPPQLRVNG